MNEGKSLDIFGVKPLADSLKIVTQGAVDGAAAFLGRICLPAAEEFGFLIKDRVTAWRAQNATKIAHAAEQLLAKSGRAEGHAHPRLAIEIIEKGSWNEDDTLQKAWAGLLASSCTEDGKDDSNVLFISLLEQLTRVEIKVLAYSCEKSGKFVSKAGWIQGDHVVVNLEELTAITGITDVHRLDRELDHLRNLGLIGGGALGGGGGFHPEELQADISPTALALHMYARCQGYVGSPIEYWNVTAQGK